MGDIVLVYVTDPPYVPGDELPEVEIDDTGAEYRFTGRAFVDTAASRPGADGGTEYLCHVTVPG